MRKHVILEVSDDSVTWCGDDAGIAAEAALDGFHIVRTNLPKTVLDTMEIVAAYKGLSVVERAFRTMKTVALKLRPIHHRLADRVRDHLLIRMPAYYVEHHMRDCLGRLSGASVSHKCCSMMSTARSATPSSRRHNRRTQRGKRRQRRRRPMA